MPPAFSRDLPPRYSAESAIAGSTRAARRAGTPHATAAELVAVAADWLRGRTWAIFP